MIEWRDVPGYDNYEVSNDGQIRRKPFVLKPGSIPSGHLTVALSTGNGKPKSMYVHRLVALAFTDNPDGKPIVNHKNGNPKDNRVENLEWATPSENVGHGYWENGRIAPASLPVSMVNSDGEVVRTFQSGAEAAKFVGVTTKSINAAVVRKGTCKGYRWVRYADS